MKKLIRGIADFRKNVRPSVKEKFAQLALGQRPDTLFIACSDSRVVPNLFASSDPGDLFVIRNVGNLIPPCDLLGLSMSDESEGAAIEFALLSLPVNEIVVCGHSECGAMNVLAQGRATVDAPHLRSWLRHGEVALDRMKNNGDFGMQLEPHNLLSQHNVLEQMEHLATYPVVRKRLAEGTLKIQGWWFDIREADVYEYNQVDRKFHLIDENYAAQLIKNAEKEKQPPEHMAEKVANKMTDKKEKS